MRLGNPPPVGELLGLLGEVPGAAASAVRGAWWPGTDRNELGVEKEFDPKTHKLLCSAS
jgi:hypothetical protein